MQKQQQKKHKTYLGVDKHYVVARGACADAAGGEAHACSSTRMDGLNEHTHRMRA